MAISVSLLMQNDEHETCIKMFSNWLDTEKSYTYNSDTWLALSSWQIGGNKNNARAKLINIARCIGRGWVNITSHHQDVHGMLGIQWDCSIFQSHTHPTSPNHPPETPPSVYRHRILGPTNHHTSLPEQNVIVGSWSLELLRSMRTRFYGRSRYFAM